MSNRIGTFLKINETRINFRAFREIAVNNSFNHKHMIGSTWFFTESRLAFIDKIIFRQIFIKPFIKYGIK